MNDLGRQASAMADALQDCVARVTRSGWYVMGPELEAFEAAFAAYCSTEHCIGVATGTDALELALRAVGVAPGDEVITVANAGFYASTAILAIGAVPAYVDVTADTLLMDSARLERALTPAVKAIVATHLYGRMLDMAPIVAIAQRAGVPVIEDCAQAHGARRGADMAGTLGAIGCFSFYPTKNLGAIGDGGALIAGDAGLAARLRRLRQYGWSSRYVTADRGGRNSRLDEIQAAVLAAKLPRLSGWNARRRAIASRYSDAIRHPRIRVAPPGQQEFVAHLYVAQVDGRDGLRAHLRSHAIASDVHYPVPDHRQAALAGVRARHDVPVTERVLAHIVSLPCFPEMRDDEVESVVEACNGWRG